MDIFSISDIGTAAMPESVAAFAIVVVRTVIGILAADFQPLGTRIHRLANEDVAGGFPIGKLKAAPALQQVEKSDSNT